MDKIEACVSDVAAIANTVTSQDLCQTKRRLELLFADVGCRAGASSGTVQNVRDQLAQALDQSRQPHRKTIPGRTDYLARPRAPWAQHMTPEACRRKALEFQRAAEIATDESVQRAYRDLASKWHERAESAEALAQRLKGTGEGPLWSQ